MPPEIISAYATAASRLLLLDYDGTLAPYAPTPEQATPTPALLQTLLTLASASNNHVVIISGRNHRTLDDWLGSLPLDFAAEHGLFIKKQGAKWATTKALDESWKQHVKSLMEQYSQNIPGSEIEETTGTLNWHYRRTDAKQGRAAAIELLAQLRVQSSRLGINLLDGNKVVIAKVGGVDKGTVARHWLDEQAWDFILAAGDDTTDEYMFRAMPSPAFTVKIGPGESVGKTRMATADDFVQYLQKLTKI